MAVKLNVEADVAIGPEAYNIKGSYDADTPNLRIKVRQNNEDKHSIEHSSKTLKDGTDTSDEDFSETFHRNRKESHKIVQRAKLKKETTSKYNTHFMHHDRYEKKRYTKHATHKHKTTKHTSNKYKETRHEIHKSTRNIMIDPDDEHDSLLSNDNNSYEVKRKKDRNQIGTQWLKKLENTAGEIAKLIPDIKLLRMARPSDHDDVISEISPFKTLKILTNQAIERLSGKKNDNRVYNFTDSVVFVNDSHITILKSKMANKPKHQGIPGLDDWIEEFKNKTNKDINNIKDTIDDTLSDKITNFVNSTILGLLSNVSNMIQNTSGFINNKLKPKSFKYATNIVSSDGNYVFKNKTHIITITQVKKKLPVIKIITTDKKHNNVNIIFLNGTTTKGISTIGDDIFIRNASTNEWININTFINTRNNFKAQDVNNDHYTKKYVFENKTHEIIATQVNNKAPVIKIKTKHLKNYHKKEKSSQYLRSPHKHKKNENNETNISRIEPEPNNWADLNYKVQQDEQIDAFTRHILRDTLKLLNNVKNNIKEYQWRNQINRVSKQYEEKFNEFLRTTRHQRIKTRLGSQKVVLNAIAMSKLIVNRLLNAAIDDLDKKGLLRSGGDAHTVYNEINKEVESKRNRACTNLGICINDKGFTHYIVEVMNTILSLNDEKYQELLDATVDAIENTDFTKTLSKGGDSALKKSFHEFQQHDIKTQKTIISIIRNLLFSKNMPLIIHEDSNADKSKLNKTVAFLEIVNALDKYQGNNEWEKIEREINDYSHNDLGINIRDTMGKFVKNVKDAIDHNKAHSRDIIRANIKTVFT